LRSEAQTRKYCETNNLCVTSTNANSSAEYTQVAYTTNVKAVFIELPAFERHRDDYLDDDSFARLQGALMVNPTAGDLIEGTGGLRKVRFGDSRRSKGKRGGLRVIYYYWMGGPEFWLFTLYDKDEMADLTPKQRAALKERVKDELKMRRKS
jgi:hypothetical protein